LFGILVIVLWNLFVIWCLYFVISGYFIRKQIMNEDIYLHKTAKIKNKGGT